MTSPISKTAVDPAVFRSPSLFYASAREGMQDLLEHHARVHPEPTVLLPSFIGWSPREGSGVLDPVRGAGLTPTFYGLHPDLSVDLVDLEERLSGTTDAVVVLIHYYGRTLPQLEAAVELAHRHGAVVIEDLAHGFFTARSDGPASRFGDVLMYSLHKMFPTPDALGGMLTYRDPALLTGQASTRPDLASYVLDYDWRAIATARRRNFELVLDGLRELGQQPGVELFWPVLSDHDVPQTLPVRVLGGRRDDVYHRMNADGFGMVSLYHTLVPELRDNAAMSELASSIINFPVHQDLDPAAIPAMVASFAASLDAP